MYDPKPDNFDDIKLPTEFDSLRETIAEHVHDTWAAGRIADGWTYGPARNDEAKEHPNLVPYDELTEADKEFDRSTAIGTLKLILSHGWTITPPKP